MRLEQRVHTETRHRFPDLGPDYSYDEEVITNYVHPEFPDEKQTLYDNIINLKPLAADAKLLLEKIKDTTIANQQSEYDDTYEMKLKQHQRNQTSWWYRNFAQAPIREKVDVDRVIRDTNDQFESITDTIAYIDSVQDYDKFYTPIVQELYENVLSFERQFKSMLNDCT